LAVVPEGGGRHRGKRAGWFSRAPAERYLSRKNVKTLRKYNGKFEKEVRNGKLYRVQENGHNTADNGRAAGVHDSPGGSTGGRIRPARQIVQDNTRQHRPYRRSDASRGAGLHHIRGEAPAGHGGLRRRSRPVGMRRSDAGTFQEPDG